jgi:hypothetical protein
MFILRDFLQPLQAHFSDTDLGRERSSLFAYTLLAIIVPFTSSITSNLLRSLVTLLGIEIKNKYLVIHFFRNSNQTLGRIIVSTPLLYSVFMPT